MYEQNKEGGVSHSLPPFRLHLFQLVQNSPCIPSEQQSVHSCTGMKSLSQSKQVQKKKTVWHPSIYSVFTSVVLLSILDKER